MGHEWPFKLQTLPHRGTVLYPGIVAVNFSVFFVPSVV